MKKTKFLVSILLSAGFSSVVYGHNYNGALGVAASATDKFYITCGSGTAKISFKIKRGTTGIANVSAKAYSPVGALATSFGATYSPLVTIYTGAGAKFFEVKKAAGIAYGVRTYTLYMDCFDATGIHNPDVQPVAVTYIQNQ